MSHRTILFRTLGTWCRPASATTAACCQQRGWASWGFASVRTALLPRLPPDLPPPADYQVKQATFVKSSSHVSNLPPQLLPEFALIGRSNVGKSSIVNQLTNSPTLAKVSKKPGCTKTINHFLINKKWHLVDCPGYGDAKVSRADRHAWHEFTKEYFLSRGSLAHIFLLLDGSALLAPIDVDAVHWINDSRRPWTLVFTKMDIVTPGQPHPLENMAQAIGTLESLLGVQPCYIPSSAASGLGTEAMLQYISQLRQSFSVPVTFK